MIDRCLAFTFAHERRASSRVVEGAWYTAFLDARIPLVWDANFVSIDEPGSTFEGIEALTDELIGGAGMEHRAVVLRDPDDAGRLAIDFERAGWEREVDEYLTLSPGWSPPGSDRGDRVRETTLDEVRAFRDEFLGGELSGDGNLGAPLSEIVDQLQERDRILAAAVGRDRWFAAGYNGGVESSCRIFEHEGVGQIEDVGTLASSRGRGLAAATVTAAASASIASGNELTFLVADADDWPKVFYAGLGFETAGTLHCWRRRPATANVARYRL